MSRFPVCPKPWPNTGYDEKFLNPLFIMAILGSAILKKSLIEYSVIFLRMVSQLNIKKMIMITIIAQ